MSQLVDAAKPANQNLPWRCPRFAASWGMLGCGFEASQRSDALCQVGAKIKSGMSPNQRAQQTIGYGSCFLRKSLDSKGGWRSKRLESVFAACVGLLASVPPC